MFTKRIVLWTKQRQFLDACLQAKSTSAQIMNEFDITNKMLALWLTKPAFRKQYQKVKNFLKEKSDLDLRIGATNGADYLTKQQLTTKRGKKGSSLELVRTTQRQKAPVRAKSSRPKLHRLSPLSLPEEERVRLIKNLYREEGRA
jgi:hypothetical protein